MFLLYQLRAAEFITILASLCALRIPVVYEYRRQRRWRYLSRILHILSQHPCMERLPYSRHTGDRDGNNGRVCLPLLAKRALMGNYLDGGTGAWGSAII